MNPPAPVEHTPPDTTDRGTAWWPGLLDWFLKAAAVGLIFYAFDRLKRAVDATSLDRTVTAVLVAAGGTSFVLGIAARELQTLSPRVLTWIMFLPAVALVCLAYRLMEGTVVDEPGMRGVLALLIGSFGGRWLVALGARLRRAFDQPR